MVYIYTYKILYQYHPYGNFKKLLFFFKPLQYMELQIILLAWMVSFRNLSSLAEEIFIGKQVTADIAVRRLHIFDKLLKYNNL